MVVAQVFYRFVMWLVICAYSAAPSFVLGMFDHNIVAMYVGVIIFAIAYTIATSTEAFERFYARSFVRTTLYVGYFARLLITLFSVAIPFVLAVDFLPGMLSVQIVGGTGLEPSSFVGTLLTTLVQGTLLNIILFIFMLVVYWIQRSTRPNKMVEQRGFEVVVTSPAPTPLRQD